MAAFAWGAVAGVITQSMSSLTFIVVSILRSGLHFYERGLRRHSGWKYRHNTAGVGCDFRHQVGRAVRPWRRERGYSQRKGVQVQACRRIILRRSYDSARPCVAQGLGRAAGGPALVRRDD